MPDPTDSPQAERLFAEAALWQIRMRGGRADCHDDFMTWIAADPRHLVAHDRTEALWQAMAVPAGPRDPAAIAVLLAEAWP